jgi:hypothetical protein
LGFSERTREEYPSLFADGDGSGDSFSEEVNFSKKWGWYTSFYALAKGDIRAFEEVGKFPITQAFTFLEFEKEKQKVEAAVIRKRMTKK